MRRRTDLLAFGLLLAVWAAPAVAQQGTADLRGRVIDEQGAVIPGATVTLRNQATGMFRQTVSNADGSYFIAGVMPGTYQMVAELSGFKRFSRPSLRLEIGKSATVDVRLEMGAVEEVVTVTSEAPIVDVTSKEVGGNLTARELTSLPTINRNFIGFVGLLPGIIPIIATESFGGDSVSVNGQDERNNNYLLDGANNNDDVIGQRAGTQARTPLEAIQEFQVLTSQFDAEFGRTTGAVINAVTKQGGNAFHGSAFGYFQDASLTAENYFVKQSKSTARPLGKPQTTNQQYGFTLGGPIIHDKAHFFGSVERVLIDRDSLINIPSRPELNDSPTTKDRVWNTLLRFDHQVTPNHTWNVRWLRESSPQRDQIIASGNPALPVTRAASREEVDVDQTVVAGLQSTFGANRFNALRVAWTQEDVAFANPNFNANGQRQDLLRPTLRHLSYVDQQSDVAQGRVNDAYQFEDTFSWFVPGWKGDHDIRLGVQYQYVDIQFDGQDNANGTFTFRSDAPFDAADPRTYPERLTIRVPGALAYGQKEHFFAAFLQDKWKLSRRLTLSLGVRYDLERIPIPERDNPRFASEDDYPVDAGDVSPRLGFAYDLTADGRTVVRGGYGRFFDKSHYELINAFVTSGVFSDSFIVQFPTSAADPGPSRGELPADPMLRGGPTVNRELLARQFPAGQRQRNRGNVFLDNPDRRVPRSDQLSLGVERALTRELSVSADYVHAFGRDQFMTQDLNPGVRRGTAATDVVDRRDPAFASSVLTRVNRGRLEFDALELQVEKRSSERYGFRISYTLSSARGNTGGNGAPQMQFQYLDELGLDRMDGPSDFDRRHNLVVSGVAEVPGTGGLTLSTVVRALSGLPFTVQDTNVDPDRNGILFDPLPAGPYSGSGAGAITVDSSGGRNGARGPSFFQADARVSYRFRFGERRLEVFGDIFNVTNRANFANPTGDRRSPNFLRVTALRDGGVPRTAQLGMRFEF